MNIQETTKIIAIISASYPQFLNNKTKEDIDLTISVWNEMLSEYEYNEIVGAIKVFNATSGSAFAPSISQLIQNLNKVKHPDKYPNEMEAWAMVRKAIRNANYEAVEEYNKLPEIVRKCVGNAAELKAWASLESEEVGTVIQSNFMRTYRSVISREKEIIPESVKVLIEQNKNIGIGEKHEN